MNLNTTEILIRYKNNPCNGGGCAAVPTSTPTNKPAKSNSGKGSKTSKDSKVSKNGSDESEHELEGFIGSAFDGMSYGPFPIDDMSIGQINEESSFF